MSKLRRATRNISASLLLTAAIYVPAGLAQTATNAPIDVKAQAITQRDAFIARIHTAGFTCSLAAPSIVVEDVPSFGQYNPETNTLRTSDWTVLSPREKAFFLQLAGPASDDSAARNLFNTAAHRWIFIHELGHWWQACNGGNAKRSHYQVEYGANRISLAYWREVDPKVADTMRPVFQSVIDHAPSPVPAGQTVEAYFNDNYQTLGPSPAYPWFMSRMNVAAFEETPGPTFAAALAAQK